MDSTKSMNQSRVQIKTLDGTADAYVIHPAAGGPWPGVILYMDAFGIRPALLEMSGRLASHGYFVLLPDLFYRSAPYAPFDPAKVATDDKERARLMQLFGSINNTLMMRDTAAYLDFLEDQPLVAVGKIGCVGYCMGGGIAISAAGTFPDRVAAAASFHGARLATDAPDSPHLLAPKIRGRIYVGIAGLDTHFTPQEKERLDSAFKSAGVHYTIETYEGVRHGFAVTDHTVYDKEAAERHWQKLLELFAQTLRPTST